MKYARMGESGLVVSRLCFGTMTFTLGDRSMEAIYKVDEKLADEMVGSALDQGINFFDTADAYAGGESEIILGRTLRERRADVVISTKYGFRSGEAMTQAGLSRRHTLWSVDQSLKRLGTDWIDLLIVHKDDPTTPLEETLAALDEVVKSGKARYIGYSNWPAWKAAAALEFQRANGLTRFITGQMYYSLVGRDVEVEVIPMMRHFGVGMMVWSPLAQGFLTGKITPDNLKSGDHRYAKFDFIPFDKTKGFEVVAKLREIAEAHGVSSSQVALAWLLTREAATSVIIGASKMSQVRDNLAAVDLELTPNEIDSLGALMPPGTIYPNWFVEGLKDRKHGEALGI